MRRGSPRSERTRVACVAQGATVVPPPARTVRRRVAGSRGSDNRRGPGRTRSVLPTADPSARPARGPRARGASCRAHPGRRHTCRGQGGRQSCSHGEAVVVAVRAPEPETRSIAHEVRELERTFVRPAELQREAELVAIEMKRSLELVGVRKQLASQEITLVVTDATKDHIATVGYDSNFGARPLARSIQNEIADPLAEMLLQGKFHAGDTVKVHPVGGKLGIERAEAEERKPEPVAP